MFSNNMFVSIKDGYRTIIINPVSISVNDGLNFSPVFDIRRNNSDVVKFNKTSISTCNIEFFVHAVETNEHVFNAVYAYCMSNNLIGDYTAFNKIWHVSRPAFYAAFNDDLESFVQFFTGCSHETRQTIIADHICYNHDAKMAGVISMSTYVGANRYCLARCKNCDAICSHCYSVSLTGQRAGLKNKLRRLHAIITAVKLSIEDVPALDPAVYPFFRFESFGDLNNAIQVNNYNLIAAANPGINFTMWTKNPGIVQRAINAGMELSNNLVIGLSSLYLNTPDIKTAKKYPFIRFLFTVYDDQYIKDHDIKINCGARSCLSCRVCYELVHYLKKDFNTGFYIINERLK